MLYALQTHMNGLIGEKETAEIASLGFDMCRIDAQDSSIDLMLDMVNEVSTAGMVPHVIVGDYHQIEALPAHAWCSWKNEPDIALGRPAPIPVWEYAAEFREATRVAAYSSVGRIGGPVCSNLNERGFTYLEDFIKLLGGWPDNAWCDMHRYGDGTFTRPHYDFRRRIFSREAEYRYLKRLIGGRSWGISETGYPSFDGLTEQDQAERLTQELVLADKEGAAFITIFQRVDGPLPDAREHHYGIQRVDSEGTLQDFKPSAYIVKTLKGLS